MKTRRIHITYLVAMLALLSLGATFAARQLLVEIGPTATVTGAFPKIKLLDTDAADADWEIEAQGAAELGDHLAISREGSAGRGIFQIHSEAHDSMLVLDRNGNIAVNGEAAQVGNEVEVFGGSGVSDTFAAVAVTPQAGGASARLGANTSTTAAVIEVDDNGNGYQTPFCISLFAPSNGLSISNLGHVGIGVDHLNVDGQSDLHVAGMGSILLDPLGSDGSWRLSPSASTGLSFINSSEQVVHFANGAPANTLVADGAGNLGLGTATADAALHLFRTDGSSSLKIEEASGTTGTRQMINLVNNGGIRFSLENSATSNRWDFNNDGAGNFSISQVGTGGSEFRITPAGQIIAGPGGTVSFTLTPGGNVTIAGALTEGSDRNTKENFQVVNCEDVLAKVVDMEITTWNYKHDQDEVRHMGPVAQDFSQAFALGENDTTIAAMDKDGVALASIQALNKKLEEKQAKIETLEQRLQAMEAAVRALSAEQ